MTTFIEVCIFTRIRRKIELPESRTALATLSGQGLQACAD